MRYALAFVCCFAVALGSDREEFETFKATHGKMYKNKIEEQFRYEVFSSNKRMIEEHNMMFNKGLVAYNLKINHFADKLPEEISAQMNGFNRSGELLNRKPGLMFLSPENVQLPSSVDWRQKGAVTPVKDQGQCGACWAFSATGSLEGQIFKKTGKLVSLSEQNLVDCGDEYGNNGCDGGLMDRAFDYVEENGIDREESYPYEGKAGQCRFKEADSVGTVSKYIAVPRGQEKALQTAVATVGPISIAINAGLRKFAYYKSGVFDDASCDPQTLNHGVLLVGYGTENGQDYWLVKNSWNTNWGEDGYVKIARNKGNLCGISSMASYPLVKTW